MISNSVVSKLWLTIVCMVALVFMLVSVLLQQFFDQYLVREQAGKLAQIAQVVERMIVNQGDLTEANKVIPNIKAVQNADVVVALPVSQNSTLKRAYGELSKGDRGLLLAGKPITQRFVATDHAYIAVYLEVPHRPVPGMIRVSQRISVLDAPMASIRNIVIFAFGLGVVLTTGLAFVVSKHLSRPLVQMNDAAEHMARGDFSSEVNVVTRDEVGRLGRTFNKLARELAQTIADLSMERDQLSSILSSLEDGVLAAALDGRITLANPPAIRRLTTANLEETGEPTTHRLPPSLMDFMHAVKSRHEPQLRELHWQSRFIIVTMMPLFESDGSRMRGVVIVLRDVTEERRLDRLRRDLLANVSHELRTPLSMMQGYAEALLDDFGSDPIQTREITEIIHDETLRMRRLVNDLLDFAQLESGQFQMSFGPVDMGALIQRTVRKFASLAADEGVLLDTDVPNTQVLVRGDVDRLEQVLTNLTDNALRHTYHNGHVQIGLQRSQTHARISVKDTGTGISEEDIPYIWERFYKADKARTRDRAGTGLGLAITKHIVHEHNGDIVVESTINQGTTFTVVIPLWESA